MGILNKIWRGDLLKPAEPLNKNRKYRRGKGEKKLATNGISSAEFDEFIRIITLQKYTARWEARKLKKEKENDLVVPTP